MRFYTYIHRRNDSNNIFYIGKGCDRRHLSSLGRNKFWMRIVKKHGFTAEIVSYWETSKEALEHESFLMWCFSDMGEKLVNVANHENYFTKKLIAYRSTIDDLNTKVEANKNSIFEDDGEELLLCAIEANGTQRNLAEKYGLTNGSISNWRDRGLPDSWCFYFAIKYFDESKVETTKNKYVQEAYKWHKGEAK